MEDRLFSIDTLAKGCPDSQFAAAPADPALLPVHSVPRGEIDAALEPAVAEERARVPGDALGQERYRHRLRVGHMRRHDAVRCGPQRMPVGQRLGIGDVESRAAEATRLER